MSLLYKHGPKVSACLGLVIINNKETILIKPEWQ